MDLTNILAETQIQRSNVSIQDQNLININLLNFITLTCLYTEMILCFALNSISIMFIFYTKSFTPISILIVNLALADMLYSSCILFYARQFSIEQPVQQSKLGCQISFIIDVSSMIVRK